jgi:hypothetical protein
MFCGGCNIVPGLWKIYSDGEVIQGGLACICMSHPTVYSDGISTCHYALWHK